jgi:hypothetical protein
MSDDGSDEVVWEPTVTSGKDDYKIVGHCPVCGRQTLRLKRGGLIHCANTACVNRVAVTALLGTKEIEHTIVVRDDESWTLQHPLRERISGDLFECRFHDEVNLDIGNGACPGAGTYRLIYVGHDPVSSSLHAPMLSWEKTT